MPGIDTKLNYLAKNPLKVFLVDAIGALLSFCALFLGLRNLDNVFGMPASILKFLSFAALTLFTFSTYCLLIKPDNWKVFLRAVIAGNLIYCLITIVVVLRNLKVLTVYDLVYFIIECCIIAGLVWVELSVLKRAYKIQ